MCQIDGLEGGTHRGVEEAGATGQGLEEGIGQDIFHTTLTVC